MKRAIILVFVLGLLRLSSAEALAYTIHYSSAGAIKSPQLLTSLFQNVPIADFSLNVISSSTILSAPHLSGTQTDRDFSYNQYDSGRVLTSCVLEVGNLFGINTPTAFSSLNPSVATIDQKGVATYVSDGSANFRVKVGNITKNASCPFSITNNTVLTVFNSFAPSSLAQVITDEMNSRIQGLSPSATTENIYSSLDDVNHSYIRNTSVFTGSVDLTSIPVYSSSSHTSFNGVLVAPDILIQANHAHSSGTMYFVANDNTTISRTVVGGTRIGDTDIWVSRLNSPLPSSITPAKVLKNGSLGIFALGTYQSLVSEGDKITSNAISKGTLPAVFSNQFRSLKIGSVNALYNLFTIVYVPGGDQTHQLPTSSLRYLPWYSEPISGDSGSPGFMIVNGQLVALGTWYTSIALSDILANITAINAGISSLGSGYSLTQIDLSAYPTY